MSLAGVFEREYKINWDVVCDILGIKKDFIDELYTLTPRQKYFLLSLLNLDVKELTPANKVAQHTRSVYELEFRLKAGDRCAVARGVVSIKKSQGQSNYKKNLTQI
ncbi:hypothetical protein DP114_18440 [Brasilonema sennae CENA114]|uniref:Uncharacterized protein n=1 Tax=Brasilonema sennae CENA114 TaxID=415709 RepID=A0A856MHA7_9CYAN|nr:hypothetical protein DP114_18440 [Brasilonema sennae CENA114]